ncbi:MAG: hypothetical protein IPM00_09010 [Tetrasphaera sp.]|nr:hypothetical protein [Tetrasphaera sp.]
MFYGEGGMGKTELSRRLASWVTGGLGGDSHWGDPPDVAHLAAGRWELNDSKGSVDVFDLLLEVRRAHGEVRREWPAFDLAFTAFARNVHPGTNLELTRSTAREREFTVGDVLSGALNDAATVADVAGAGLAGIGLGMVRSYTMKKYRSAKTQRVFKAFDGLEELVRRCEELSGAEGERLDAAIDVAYMLSREVDALDPMNRPTVTIFIDHFERLQVSGAAQGERAVNGLVFALPYCLFVVTGRNALKWYEAHQTHLINAGGRCWPNLAPEAATDVEPRQHILGRLSQEDSVALLRSGIERLEHTLEPGLVEELARETGGWPLHLDTIIDVARGKPRNNVALTADDLGGPLPSLVNRLFEDLPADEAEALRAACLLPYFDAELAARAADQTVGAAERLCRRSIVKTNPGSIYPHRIHDEIRHLVRRAGAAAAAGWAEADWTAAAVRALVEAQRRFDRNIELEQDVDAVDSLALILNISSEHSLYPAGIVESLAKSPTIRGLSERIPALLREGASKDLTSIVDYVRAMSEEVSQSKLDILQELGSRGASISNRAILWRAYGLRQLGRFDECISELESLLKVDPDLSSLYHYQRASTLCQARRFSDALAARENLTSVQMDNLTTLVQSCHGLYEGRSEALTARLALKRDSRRFALELESDILIAKHRTGGVSPDTLADLKRRSQAVDHRLSLIVVEGIQGQQNLFRSSWEASREALEEYARLRRTMTPQLPMLLALRGWATDDKRLLDEAHQICDGCSTRTSAWIGVEALLKYLGRPVTPIPGTQWQLPYAEVEANWVRVLKGIVDRARINSARP